jgi:hypothetical protein
MSPDRCRVRLFHLPLVSRGEGKKSGGLVLPTCGRSVVAHGLCEEHYADRIRLGGTP